MHTLKKCESGTGLPLDIDPGDMNATSTQWFGGERSRCGPKNSHLEGLVISLDLSLGFGHIL